MRQSCLIRIKSEQNYSIQLVDFLWLKCVSKSDHKETFPFFVMILLFSCSSSFFFFKNVVCLSFVRFLVCLGCVCLLAICFNVTCSLQTSHPDYDEERRKMRKKNILFLVQSQKFAVFFHFD